MRRPVGGLRAGRWLGRVALVAVLAGLWLVAAVPRCPFPLRESGPPRVVPRPGAAPGRATFTSALSLPSGIQVLTRRPAFRARRGRPVEGEPLQFAVRACAGPTGPTGPGVVSKDDGHVTAGSFAFGVGVPAPTATPQAQSAPQGASPSPSAPATAARLALYAGLTILVGVAVTGLAVAGRVLPSGARALLAVAAALTVAGGVVRFLAEQARIDAPLGTLLASSTGQGLLRLAAGVVATAVATWFLAAGLARPPDALTPDPSSGTPDPALAAPVPHPAGRSRPSATSGPDPGDTGPPPSTSRPGPAHRNPPGRRGIPGRAGPGPRRGRAPGGGA